MRARRRWPSRFNWASTSRSKKHPEFSPARRCRTSLQLGLDLAVEETWRQHHAFTKAIEQLQLGLDLAVEETPKGLGFVAPFYSLQLGLDLAVEETWMLRARLHRTKSFNWASTSRSRKPCCRRCWP